MKLIATKDISSQLPAGTAFERANPSDGNILIAMGVARQADEATDEAVASSVTETSTTSSRRRRGQYRTRHLVADHG